MTSLLMAAAISGIVSGAEAKTQAPSAESGVHGAQMLGEKHACKGQNACKGQGGCKTGDGGCASKNSCKGKGGCESPIKAKATEKAPEKT